MISTRGAGRGGLTKGSSRRTLPARKNFFRTHLRFLHTDCEKCRKIAEMRRALRAAQSSVFSTSILLQLCKTSKASLTVPLAKFQVSLTVLVRSNIST